MKKTLIFAIGAVCGAITVKYCGRIKNAIVEKYNEAKAEVEAKADAEKEGEEFEPVDEKK